jgi:hypothetical protein
MLRSAARRHDDATCSPTALAGDTDDDAAPAGEIDDDAAPASPRC